MNRHLVVTIHAGLTIAQVLAALLFIELKLLPLALLAALSGKWRVFSIYPYRFLRNLRANSCDVIVIISSVVLMHFYVSRPWILAAHTVFLSAWLLFLKPARSRVAIAAQAACCQFLGLTALWLMGVEQGLVGVVAIAGAAGISYFSARHLSNAISGEDATRRRIMALAWAVMTTQLAWLCWTWSITYRLPGELLIPQYSLIAVFLGYFASHHMFVFRDHKRRLPTGFIVQQSGLFALVLAAIIILTPWLN